MLADGTLAHAWLIGETDTLRFFGMRLILNPDIAVDAFGRIRTSWRISGLKSSLVPSGREILLWQPPGGAPVAFKARMIERTFARAGQISAWQIRRVGPEVYEMRSGDGTLWRYNGGLPVSVTHPRLGKLTFTTQGAHIREIQHAASTGQSKRLLLVEYDQAARFHSVTIGTEATHRFIWSEAGELTDWQHGRGSNLVFTYHDGLLSGVAEDGQTPEKFSWRENPGWRRGNSIWPMPAHLASDNHCIYSYAMTRKGFVLGRTERDSARHTELVYRPKHSPLDQRR